MLFSFSFNIGCFSAFLTRRFSWVNIDGKLLSVIHLDVFSGGFTLVILTRSDDVVFLIIEVFVPIYNYLIIPVCQPTSNSRDSEQHWEHVSRESHGSVDNSRVEINVGIELSLDEEFIWQGDLLQFNGYLDEGLLSTDFEDFISDLEVINYFTFLTILALGS